LVFFIKKTNEQLALLAFLSEQYPNYLIKSMFNILSYVQLVFQTT